MSTQAFEARSRQGAFLEELAKLPAFLRRDLRIALSYRAGFITSWFGLVVQVVLFYFIGHVVNPGSLPTYGGKPTGYMAFAMVGIALGGFMQIALARVSVGIRNEQLVGTLESLLLTPTSATTIQLGTVFYELLWIPLRITLFLAGVALIFGLNLHAGGAIPALVVLVAFIPFVWGIGVANAGLVLTFRRGTGAVGFGATALTLLSGAYVPLDVLPHWLATVARHNPLAVAIEAMRQMLLGGSGMGRALIAVAEILPFSAVSLAVGFWIFGLALRRERRLGTLGLY